LKELGKGGKKKGKEEGGSIFSPIPSIKNRKEKRKRGKEEEGPLLTGGFGDKIGKS